MFEPVQHGKGGASGGAFDVRGQPGAGAIDADRRSHRITLEIAGDPVNDAEHSTAGALTGVNVAVTSQPAGLVLVSLPGVDFV